MSHIKTGQALRGQPRFGVVRPSNSWAYWFTSSSVDRACDAAKAMSRTHPGKGVAVYRWLATPNADAHDCPRTCVGAYVDGEFQRATDPHSEWVD